MNLETMTTDALKLTVMALEQEAQALDADPRACYDLPCSDVSQLTEEAARRSLVPIKAGDDFIYKPLAKCVWADLIQLHEFKERHMRAHQAVQKALEVLMLRVPDARPATEH